MEPKNEPPRSLPGSLEYLYNVLLIVVRPIRKKPNTSISEKAVIVRPKEDNGAPPDDLVDTIDTQLADLKLAPKIFVQLENQGGVVDSATVMGPKEDYVNRHIADHVLKDPVNGELGSCAGKLNNRGCARAWLFEFDAALKDFKEARANSEAANAQSPTDAATAEIQKIVDDNIDILNNAWKNWKMWKDQQAYD